MSIGKTCRQANVGSMNILIDKITYLYVYTSSFLGLNCSKLSTQLPVNSYLRLYTHCMHDVSDFPSFTPTNLIYRPQRVQT